MTAHYRDVLLVEDDVTLCRVIEGRGADSRQD